MGERSSLLPDRNMKTTFVLLALFYVVSVVSETEERAGGIFGLGLLPFGDTTESPSSAPSGPIEQLLSLLSPPNPSTAETDTPSPDLIQTLINVMTGVVTSLDLNQVASMLGINTTPIPSPLSDPLGFLTHPLITPIIIAVVTMNVPSLALAQGALAGNLILTHFLTQQAQDSG